jgi:alpha-D-xyloside xylohydrolase
VPWNYNAEACDVLRFFTKLKLRLMPYLYAAAVEAHQHGIPMMRAMVLEFPDDRACDSLDRQYMLGSSLLVAPVFTEDGWSDYYLPAGRWTHLLTGEQREGGRWHRTQHDFLSMPLYVRPNTVLALGSRDDRPDYEFAQDVTFSVYALEDGATAKAEVPTMAGTPAVSVEVTRSGSSVRARVTGAKASWKLLLVGISGAKSAKGGVVSNDARGTLVSAESSSAQIEVLL